MLFSDLHNAFNIKLDKTNSLSYPDFEDAEVDFWLNEGIDEFIKTSVFGTLENKVGFDGDLSKRNDLKNIIKLSTLKAIDSTPVETSLYGVSKRFNLLVNSSDAAIIDFEYLLSLKVTMSDNNQYNVDVISNIEMLKLIENDNNIPYLENPVACFTTNDAGTATYVTIKNDYIDYKNGYLINSANMFYIKTPTTIDYASTPAGSSNDFSDAVFNKIVDIAVNKALENIESQRFQTNTIELKTNI